LFASPCLLDQLASPDPELAASGAGQELTLEQKSELEPEQDDDGDLERKTRKSAEWNPPGSL
jgi:hypothetical protein